MSIRNFEEGLGSRLDVGNTEGKGEDQRADFDAEFRLRHVQGRGHETSE